MTSSPLRLVGAGLVLAAGLYLLTGGDRLEVGSEYEADEPDARRVEPARIEPVEGMQGSLIRFSGNAARRVGLQTAVVQEDGGKKVVPRAAVLYDPEGRTFVYTSPERLTFVREAVVVERIHGESVVLADGPPVGTGVVTIGAAEVYGTEFEVSH